MILNKVYKTKLFLWTTSLPGGEDISPYEYSLLLPPSLVPRLSLSSSPGPSTITKQKPDVKLTLVWRPCPALLNTAGHSSAKERTRMTIHSELLTDYKGSFVASSAVVLPSPCHNLYQDTYTVNHQIVQRVNHLL